MAITTCVDIGAHCIVLKVQAARAKIRSEAATGLHGSATLCDNVTELRSSDRSTLSVDAGMHIT